MHNGINPPKLVIDMIMQPGQAKTQNVNRQVVRKLLSEYTPSAKLRSSEISSIGIEAFERDTLRVTVAIKKEFAPESVVDFVATMQGRFARTFRFSRPLRCSESPVKIFLLASGR